MSQIYRKVCTGISFSKGRPVLDIFCRTKDNERKVVKIYNLSCYFYVNEDEHIEEEDMKKSVICVNHGYVGLYGEKLKKVTVKKISEVRRLGKIYHGFESDVKWDKKMLLDLKITDKFLQEDDGRVHTLDGRFNALNDVEQEILTDDGVSISTTIENNVDKMMISKAVDEEQNLHNYKPKFGNVPFEVKHGIFDIEVIVENLEDLRTRNGKMVCVVIYDSYSSQYHELRLETTERDLIERTLDKFRELDFDLISGWNVSFDMGWIITKAIDYDIDLSLYFPGGKTFVNKYTDFEGKFREDFYLGGRILIDGMDLYIKKTSTTEKLNSYSLKSVAMAEKLPEWEDYGAKVKEMWDKDPDIVVKYCKLDVERTMQIIQKKDLLGGALTICKFYGCGFDDVITNSKVIDSLTFMLKKNRILPNIVRGREKANIVGAKVLKTIAGLHKNVGIFDAASLYPSIIGGLNISPECLVPGVDLYEDHRADCISVDIDGVKHYLYKKEYKMGLMTEVIQEMRKLREQIRSDREQATEDGDKEKFALLNNEEKVAKGVLASVYGVMGFNGFRLFNENCANIITGVARGMINEIMENLKDSKCKIIAGDTDSIFVQIPNADYGFTAMDEMNDITYNYIKNMGVDEQIIKMNYEKFFKWVMFSKRVSPKLKSKIYKRDTGSAKKKYIGFISHVQTGPREMKEVNELYYKGFELRRSDSAKILKDVMRKFFNLMEDGDYHKSVAYLKEIKKTFNNHPVDYISMPRTVNNEDIKGPWADGLRYSKEHLKFEFNSDEMPKLIYVKNQYSYPKTNVLCYQDGHVIPSVFEIDYEVMFDKIIRAKFETILESLGLYWDTYINDQQTLDSWA